jgi:hypothetical protein
VGAREGRRPVPFHAARRAAGRWCTGSHLIAWQHPLSGRVSCMHHGCLVCKGFRVQICQSKEVLSCDLMAFPPCCSRTGAVKAGVQGALPIPTHHPFHVRNF